MYCKALPALWIVCLLFCHPAPAQQQYQVQRFDNSNGLSNSCINYIYQDADQLLWMGTWDGLNVYDGDSYHVFNYASTDSGRSLASNIIYQIGEDSDNCIWLGTIAGISEFNKRSGKFRHFFYERGNVTGNGFLLATGEHNEVFAGPTGTNRLQVFDQRTGRFQPCRTKGARQVPIRKIMFLKGRLWALCADGQIDIYAVDNAALSRQQTLAPGEPVQNLLVVNNKILLVTEGHKLYEVTANNHFNYLQTLAEPVQAAAFFSGTYLFAWTVSGYGAYDAQFQPTTRMDPELRLLNHSRITSFFSPSGQVLWIGTDGIGALKLSAVSSDFGLVRSTDKNGVDHAVRSFNLVGREWWVGTKGNGIMVIDSAALRPGAFPSGWQMASGTRYYGDNVYAITRGTDSLVYIGSDAKGITIYDAATRRFTGWSSIEGIARFPAFSSVHSIYHDTDGSLWLGLNSSGLIHLKIIRKQEGGFYLKYLNLYTYNGSDKGPVNDVIYTIAKGNSNQLWIGCRYGGLSVFDMQTRRFRTFSAFTGKGSLSNNDVLSLWIDTRHRIWIGTSFGLNWIPEKETHNTHPVFHTMTMEDGLPNNTIHAISEDNSGAIWISTNKGLARIDPGHNQVVQYKKEDGLQSDEFSDNAVFKTSDGLLFFGGIYGFNFFNPRQLQTSTFIPNLLFTIVNAGGETTGINSMNVLTPASTRPLKEITVPASKNFFELHVSPITYENLQKARYSYFLAGYDTVWHGMESDMKITYSNLPPGSYQLKIRWTNGEGVWTDNLVAALITVKPYFWLTLPAIIIYISLIAGAGFIYLRYKRNKFLFRQRLSVEQLLRKKEEDLYTDKIKFFTNIAHELQTPLTLISGAIDRFTYRNQKRNKPEAEHFLAIARQESSRLIYLVHQLLEFRKTDAGHAKLYVTDINISALLANICSLFTPLTEQRNINFVCEVPDGIMLTTDKDKLEKIVFNLLSNAFKYSAEEPEVRFGLKRSKEGAIEIAVANSGCALSEEEAARLFDEFYTKKPARPDVASTGIGLAFTQQLVELLKGTIKVNVWQEWITFTVQLAALPPDTPNQLSVEMPVANDRPSQMLRSVVQHDPSLKVATIQENNQEALFLNLENDSRRSILVVEDEQAIRFLLRDILAEEYNVYEAANGQDALDLLKRIVPNVIISDIMMPDMDGLAFCKIVKTTPQTCHLPFILLSALGSIEQKAAGYEVGADAYIPKPFQSEYLLVRIRKLIDYQQRLYGLLTENNLALQVEESSGIKPDDKIFLDRLIEVIREHIDKEDMDAAFLEDKIGMSRMHLYRRLKSLSNMTPAELIRNVRLQYAATLLQSSAMSVSEIFYAIGFNNQSYFYREFKKKYGVSPNAYRANYNKPAG